jgi:ankyrin repeat protein
MFTSKNNHTTIMKVLLENGADESIKDNKGKTAEDYSRQNKYAIGKFIRNKNIFGINY